MTKQTTSSRIRAYLSAHPDAADKEVAAVLNVSSNRVATVKWRDKTYGQPKRKYAKKPAPNLIKFMGVTMSKEDIANITPDQADRIVEASTKPKARMLSQADLVKPVDMVNSPPHYKIGGIETIDFIKAKLTPEEFRGYLKGNVMKYASRTGYKGDALQDAGKMAWYANRLEQTL